MCDTVSSESQAALMRSSTMVISRSWGDEPAQPGDLGIASDQRGHRPGQGTATTSTPSAPPTTPDHLFV
jgi:hypothetical protein